MAGEYRGMSRAKGEVVSPIRDGILQIDLRCKCDPFVPRYKRSGITFFFFSFTCLRDSSVYSSSFVDLKSFAMEATSKDIRIVIPFAVADPRFFERISRPN